MKLYEVLNEGATDDLKRKIDSLDAVLRDPSTSDGEKRNAGVLRDRLYARLQQEIQSEIPRQNPHELLKQRLVTVLQNRPRFCSRPSYGHGTSFNWVAFVDYLNTNFSDVCRVIGRSPGSAEYAISADYQRPTITISYDRSQVTVTAIDHFLGKLLFMDLMPIILRMQGYGY